MTETFWLSVGTLGMLGGSCLHPIMGGTRTQDEEGHTLAHGLVPLFAAIAYFSMAVHQRAITLAGNREFLFARYIDWSVTTDRLLCAAMQLVAALTVPPMVLEALDRSSWMMPSLMARPGA